MAQEYPFTIRKLRGVFNTKIINEFKAFTGGMVQVGQDKWLLPAKYEQFAEEIYNFEARPDDVFICTFPRSGTTWTQEMIWLICNNLDYETALSVPLMQRFPFME
jgi:Sulfotransferase domain